MILSQFHLNSALDMLRDCYCPVWQFHLCVGRRPVLVAGKHGRGART
jgi:hypothetical protein